MSCYFIGKITHNYPQSYPEGAEMSILFLKIKQINKDGWYWAEGPVVMCNYGDTHTFTFCMCRNHAEAKAVASGLNILDWNDMHEEDGSLE